MTLQELKPRHGAKHSRKRIGRGNGSGHGTFSTHGCKGQKARSGGNIPARFEGGQTPLVRRLPKLKGFNNPNNVSYKVVNVGQLNIFDDGTQVTAELLIQKRLTESNNKPVKILGEGELKKKLHIKIDRVSASARAKIEQAQGTVEEAK